MTLRIAFFVNSSRYFITHRAHLAQEVLHRGWSVLVMGPVDSQRDLRAINKMGIDYYHINVIRGGRNPLVDGHTVWHARSFIEEWRPTILHNVGMKCIVLGTLASALGPRKPHVINAITGLGHVFVGNSPGDRLRRELLKGLLRLQRRYKRQSIIVQNEEDRLFITDSIGHQVSTVKLIRGSGVDVDTFAVAEIPTAPPVVLYSGRLLWTKGVREFVEAANLVKLDEPETRFVLMGGLDSENPAGIERSEVERWVSEGSVEWWGEVPHEEVPQGLAQASIVCLPSYREGLPKALLEAFASARPIVTTDVPGCRELVTPETGRKVPPGNGKQLAAEIMELLEMGRNRLMAMGEAGRKRLEEECLTAEAVSRETVRLYAEVISGRNASHHVN